jgi:hypothetical protein
MRAVAMPDPGLKIGPRAHYAVATHKVLEHGLMLGAAAARRSRSIYSKC